MGVSRHWGLKHDDAIWLRRGDRWELLVKTHTRDEWLLWAHVVQQVLDDPQGAREFWDRLYHDLPDAIVFYALTAPWMEVRNAPRS